jgi:hypothetical protein
MATVVAVPEAITGEAYWTICAAVEPQASR